MTDDATEGGTFRVLHTPLKSEEAVLAGIVSVDAMQRLRLVSAEPAFADKIGLMVDMLNSADHLVVNVPPPEGEMTRQQFRRTVARGAPDATDALRTILDERYGFRLEPGD